MDVWSAPALAATAAALTILAVVHRSARSVPSEWVDPVPADHRGLARRIGSIPAVATVVGTPRLRSMVARGGGGRTVEDIAGAKVALAGIGVATGALLVHPVVGPLLLGAGAFRVPDVLLRRAVSRRRANADREIPVFLDLLAACATAGLTGQLAARRAAEATEGPLAEELTDAFRRVDLGGRWRDELRGVAERLDLPDLHRAAAVLSRSDTIGASFAEAVSELARESRETRRAIVSERARKAPVKMLFPLVFLVLPAFLLLTVVPVLVATLQSIR